jgi:hypothetical protein
MAKGLGGNLMNWPATTASNNCSTGAQAPNPGAGDDVSWFYLVPNKPGEVQLESLTGMLPFIAETDKDNETVKCFSIEEAAQVVMEWLRLTGGSSTSFWYKVE